MGKRELKYGKIRKAVPTGMFLIPYKFPLRENHQSQWHRMNGKLYFFITSSHPLLCIRKLSLRRICFRTYAGCGNKKIEVVWIKKRK
jgi:hypothetical protein